MSPHSSRAVQTLGTALALSFATATATAAAASAAGLVNISSRAVAAGGNDALIAGFVLDGSQPETVLVRAAGPALVPFGVTGALTEARIDLMQGQSPVASNSGWDAGTDAAAIAAAAASVNAFDFAPGSKDAALLITLAPGLYSAVVTPARDGIAPGVALVEIYDTTPASGARLVNISTRARVGTGDDVLIAGFVLNVGGRRVLMRAAGPALGDFGVDGTLADPVADLFQVSQQIGGDDDWTGGVDAYEVASRAVTAGAFPLAEGSTDAAFIAQPQPGEHTVVVSGKSGGSGVALVELYDLNALTLLPPVEAFDLVGFARIAAEGLAAFTGGGAASTPYDPVARTGNHWVIDEATRARADFGSLFRDALGGDTPLVVEINTAIDLSVHGTPDTNSNRSAIAHPDLFTPGQTTGRVGILSIGSNKTIYSGNGASALKRGKIQITGRSNIAIRNLRFSELWEWDDATTGEYDRNDWDYINIASLADGTGAITTRAHHIWIDHCEFANAYDGQLDVIRGSDFITVSWCRFGGGFSGDAATWVERQMAHLEANRSSFPYYASLRTTRSAESVLAAARAQKKSSLVGNGTSATNQAQDSGHLNVTYHHNWYHGVDQRMPRMRFGNAHVFNLWVDDTPTRDIASLSQSGVAATSEAAMFLQNSTFVDVRTPVNNKAGSEATGTIAISQCNNFDRATGLNKGFDNSMLIDVSAFRWNAVAPSSGLANWPNPSALTLPGAYFPAGVNADAYVHPGTDHLRTRLHQAGVIAPASDADAATLRLWLQAVTPSHAAP